MSLFKRKRRWSFKAFVIWVTIVVFITTFLWIDLTLRSTIFKIAQAKAVQMATEAINSSVQQKIVENQLQYQDFVQVHKDIEGRVVLMQANTVKVTKMAADVTLAVQSTLQKLDKETFTIPLGQVTGTQLLAGLGPKVRVTIIPVGTVRVDVEDKFDPAGINQTRHRIWLDFNTQIRIVIPSKSAQAQVATKVPLAESIIVGEVPGTFVNISGGLFSGGIIK